MENMKNMKRGDVYFADLSGVRGSEQGGKRPILVIQNNIGNKYSTTIIIAAITSSINKPKMSVHVGLDAIAYNLPKDSVILLEQIRTIDKSRILSDKKIAILDEEKMAEVDNAIMMSLGMAG